MIIDSNLVKQFFHRLDNIQRDEVYMILGGARKKYAKDDPTISTSHEIVTRQLVKDYNVDLFFQAVRKADALLNVSVDKNTGLDFPKISHVIYCGINPRSTIRAKAECDAQMNRYFHTLLLNESDQGRIDAYNQIKRFKVHYYSALQKMPTDRRWRILDIDVKKKQLLADCIGIINQSNIKFITETHGGYHIIYDRRANEFLLGKKMLDDIKKEHDLKFNEIATFKDRLTPIWGTEQGGFMVRPVVIE